MNDLTNIGITLGRCTRGQAIKMYCQYCDCTLGTKWVLHKGWVRCVCFGPYFAIILLGFHLYRTIKSSNFECKYWKLHVSSLIRSWDIALQSLDLSPWVPLMGNLKSVTIYQKMVVCGKSHSYWTDISIVNRVRLTLYCSFVFPFICGLSWKRRSFCSKIKEIWHRWVRKVSLTSNTGFHGEQLFWWPSWLSRLSSFGWKQIFRQLDCANWTSISIFQYFAVFLCLFNLMGFTGLVLISCTGSKPKPFSICSIFQ